MKLHQSDKGSKGNRYKQESWTLHMYVDLYNIIHSQLATTYSKQTRDAYIASNSSPCSSSLTEHTQIHNHIYK